MYKNDVILVTINAFERGLQEKFSTQKPQNGGDREIKGSDGSIYKLNDKSDT